MLLEMLFCPIMFYGSANPHDMDFGQFSIMFRSIFIEGLARPPAGIREILKKLVRRFKELGGELRLRAGVQRLAPNPDEVRVVLDDADELSARQILSSAGWCETVRMCDAVDPEAAEAAAASSIPPAGAAAVETQPASGQLSFVESVSTLDVKPAEIGHPQTIVFFNDSEKFHWERPDVPVDLRSGVVCSPNNFNYSDAESAPTEGSIRLTSLANFDYWNRLPEAEYAEAKKHWYERMVESAVQFISDFRTHVVAIDVFTPKRFAVSPATTMAPSGAEEAIRRHNRPEKRLPLRDRPGPGRYHRGNDQRHPYGQPPAHRRSQQRAELTAAIGVIILL